MTYQNARNYHHSMNDPEIHDDDYHYPIVFLTTITAHSSSASAAIDNAYNVAKQYEGVYIMTASDDSKETLFQAGILAVASSIPG
jgi:hypothetical protein